MGGKNQRHFVLQRLTSDQHQRQPQAIVGVIVTR